MSDDAPASSSQYDIEDMIKYKNLENQIKAEQKDVPDIRPEINWSDIPIPEEIGDLGTYLKSTFLPGLVSQTRLQCYPVAVDLVEMIQPHWTVREFDQAMIQMRRKYRFSPNKIDLISVYRDLRSKNLAPANPTFEKLVKRKQGKSESGICSITMLLGPGAHSCRADCDYCPNDPSISRSYLLDEPAVRRGFSEGWDPIRQFLSSANRLYHMGHEVTKVEVIIEGGTFTNYPHDYINDYFRDFIYAANTFLQPLRPKMSLQEEIMANQSSTCAIIGITVETRPDWITRAELLRYRHLGVTRVQIGIQHLDDAILDGVNRQCPTVKTIQAIRLLKSNGFKCDGHFMPDLPGSSYEIDFKMFQWLFSDKNEDIQLDQLKIYPTMTLKFTEILERYKRGEYKPYAEIDGGLLLDQLMRWICLNVPRRIRINRMIRDMPMKYSQGGVSNPSLRQKVEDEIKSEGLIPRDIRGREVKGRAYDPRDSQIWYDKYKSSGGTDYFISCENQTQTILYGFIRLRLCSTEDKWRVVPVLKGAALVRELHVYGLLVKQDHHKKEAETQHSGIGKRLMYLAELKAWEQGYRKIAIIAGIGVRGYYAKLGYHLEDTYMVKTMTQRPQPPGTKPSTNDQKYQVLGWLTMILSSPIVIYDHLRQCYQSKQKTVFTPWIYLSLIALAMVFLMSMIILY